MRAGAPEEEIEVRVALPGDVGFAASASAMISKAARDHDIAERDEELLAGKITSGRAAVAVARGELVGFGFFSEWEQNAFVSHSGLVVSEMARGTGVGRALKMCLFEASESMFPEATTMSLTTSEAVKAMNLSLGFSVVPLDQLTVDEAFWDGCRTCRNFSRIQRDGLRCCCEGMIRPPGGND